MKNSLNRSAGQFTVLKMVFQLEFQTLNLLSDGKLVKEKAHMRNRFLMTDEVAKIIEASPQVNSK